MARPLGKLTIKVMKKLQNAPVGLVTYGELAKSLKTNARAIGQAVKAVGKINPALAQKVTYNPRTVIKSYEKRAK